MSNEHPMGADLQQWLTQRFDRLDDKLDERTSALAQELKATRHAQRGSIDQIALQAATLVTISNELKGELGKHDERLGKQAERLGQVEGWRNRITGGMAVVVFLFPATVGVIVTALR